MKISYIRWIAVWCLSLILIWFLLKDSWLWLYQDSFYWPLDRLHTWEIFKTSTAFNIYSNYWYYLWYNTWEFAFTRIIPFYPLFLFLNLVFWSYIGQALFVLSWILSAFWFSKKLMSLFTSNNSSAYAVALFYTFNPYLIAILNQSYIHAYAWLPLLLYSIYKYFIDDNILNKYILSLFLAIFLLLSYLRFIFIGIILGVIFFIFLIKHFKFIFRKIIILLGFSLFVFMPIIASFIWKMIWWWSSASSNFAEIFKWYIPVLWSVNTLNLFQYINIKGIYENKIIFMGISILLLIFILWSFITKDKKNNTIKIWLTFLVVGMFFINMW